ncbi:hypothetical protein PY650_33055 [Rhizobium calliandrae]|uniref:MobA-like NTP transferase domain-containing protein n=1 Tax=Rhizobium calliandrae TaxID=1312182 RepID=A0ABT7KNZ3_9HYPH|nr:hypothetical protein [Rhizobium calliandrae]MDL2410346.1 hypothetical protein [Rhizobium calliandrae]
MSNGTGAFILAAGMGSRLRPYADFVPELLAGASCVPMLHSAPHQFAELGSGEAMVVLGCRKEIIEQSCGRRLEEVELQLSAAHCSDTRRFKIDSEVDLPLAEEIFPFQPALAFSDSTTGSLVKGTLR